VAPNRSFKCGWEGWGWLGKLCEGYARRGRKAISTRRGHTFDLSADTWWRYSRAII
jgi:hypothetical protein